MTLDAWRTADKVATPIICVLGFGLGMLASHLSPHSLTGLLLTIIIGTLILGGLRMLVRHNYKRALWRALLKASDDSAV